MPSTAATLAGSFGARLRHLYVIGANGTGKSWLMRHLIAQDLAAGEGVAVIDPLGDLATAVLSLVSLERAPHLIYIDPADLERPVGFNVQAASKSLGLFESIPYNSM